jgi:NADPH:quinone reductase
MKSARLKSFGSPIQIESVDLPLIGDKDIVVKIHYAGINFYELLVMDGKYPTTPNLPTTPGGEFAGEVIDMGKDVVGFKRGDRVFSLAQTGKGTTGSYAEMAIVNEQYLYPLPKDISFEVGAAFPMITFTAYTMLCKRINMPKDGVILVHSAAGGVGSTLVQLIKSLYPKTIVIGTCSSEQKVKFVMSLGADLVVNTNDESFVDKIHNKFSKGIDVIFDPTGNQYIDDNLSLLTPFKGVICSYGAYTGPIVDPSLVAKLRKDNLTLVGFLMWPVLEDKKLCIEIFTDIFDLFKKKGIKPIVDKIFSIEDINEAIARIRQRQNIGKVLIKI